MKYFILLFLDTKWIYISTYVGRRFAGGLIVSRVLSEWKVTFEAQTNMRIRSHSSSVVQCLLFDSIFSSIIISFGSMVFDIHTGKAAIENINKP